MFVFEMIVKYIRSIFEFRDVETLERCIDSRDLREQIDRFLNQKMNSVIAFNAWKKKQQLHERESQISQRVRKDIEIEEILSSSTSKFFRFSVFDFANKENCVRNREIVSSDREKWSRQCCIINERLYIESWYTDTRTVRLTSFPVTLTLAN
jgi:hypothetical protein